MVFDSKLKINLYHVHFPDTSEKYARFSKFTFLFSIMYVSKGSMRLSLRLLSFLHHSLLFYIIWKDFWENLAQHVRFPFFEKLKLFN